MKRIALLVKDTNINGGNRVAVNLSIALIDLGYQIDLVSNCKDSNISWATSKKISILTLNQSLENKYDVAISTYFSEERNLLRIRAIRKIKYVQANYCKDGEETISRINLSNSYLNNSNADIVVVSKYLKNKLNELLIPSQVICPAIDHDLFYKDNVNHSDKFIVLVEGSLNKWKKVKESYNSIPSSYEIWGLGPEEHGMNASKMWINPAQNMLKQIYSSCDVLVKLSVKEGHPLTILEAMKCGLIPIVSNDGGHLDYCINNKNSFIVNNSDEVETCLTHIKEMKQCDLIEMKLEAYKTATKRNWKAVAENFDCFFNKASS